MDTLELLRLFYEDRPLMSQQNQSVEFLLSLLATEVGEVFQEPDPYMSPEKYLEQELADVLIITWSALQSLMGDAGAAIREKIARNMVKYPAHFFNNGLTYEAAISQAREEWKQISGNEEFYQWKGSAPLK